TVEPVDRVRERSAQSADGLRRPISDGPVPDRSVPTHGPISDGPVPARAISATGAVPAGPVPATAVTVAGRLGQSTHNPEVLSAGGVASSSATGCCFASADCAFPAVLLPAGAGFWLAAGAAADSVPAGAVPDNVASICRTFVSWALMLSRR